MEYDPKLAYAQMLANSFCSLLSPQELPHNMSARLFMDEELWMPIRVLAKLPALDHLFISDVMFPFVTQALYNFASHYLEVDVIHEIVRPKWALRSSVFISNVDMYATADQVFGLLEDLCSPEVYLNNPFEFDNIIISKQTVNSWSISFKSPSAGPYAAASMKSKCINGTLVIPTACVHINPPRAAYWNMNVVVTEVDAMQYGNPVIPVGYVQHYSENPSHFNQPYVTSAMGSQGPMQYEYTRPGAVPFYAPDLRERSYSNQSFCTQPSVEKKNELDGDSSPQTSPTCDQFENESRSSADLDTVSAKSKAKNETEKITQNDIASPLSECRGAERESQGVFDLSEASSGKLSLPTRKLNNQTPSNEALHHTAAKIPDTVEPTEVVKIGGQAATQTAVASTETKPSSSSPKEMADSGEKRTANTTEDEDVDRHDSFENGCITPPNPQNLHTPSFAKQVHLEKSFSGERKEGQKKNEGAASQPEKPTQTFGITDTNIRCAGDPGEATETRKERKEWRAHNQAYSGERHSGKGQIKQPPQGRRKNQRLGLGASPNNEGLPDNSSNGSGPRKKNGQNKKLKNKGQRFNTQNHQRSSYPNDDFKGESRDHHEDLSNADHTQVASDKNTCNGHRGNRDEDWETISYQRLGPKRNRRSSSSSEGSSHNRGRKNGNLRDGRLSLSSSNSFS